MISSLRAYKGIFILLELAKSLPEYEFCMVLGSTQKEVIQFKEKFKPTANIAIYSEQSNLHTFYQKADLILNLTIPSLSIESFGITILEGMTYGLPCIVPPIGGPLELVDNGINGFTIDSRDLDLLKKKIIEILSNPTLYRTLSEKAIKKAETFYQNKQIEMIIEDIKNIV